MEIAGVADRTESAVGSKEEPTWSEDGTVPVVLDDTMTRPGVENGFPRGQTREGGSLTIAPASAAREIPGWPESVLEATPGSGRRAYLVGHSEGCEVTIVRNHDGRIERATIPGESWPKRMVDLGVTGVCIDDRGMFRMEPALTSDIEALVRRGIQVVVATDDAEDEFNLVARPSHLKPQLLLQHTMPADEVWRTVREQTGDALNDHRTLIETVCGCHPILVHLFLTALCHTRDGEPDMKSAVIDSLADAVIHVLCTQFPRIHDQAIFLLCLALRGDPVATVKVGQDLESTSLGAHSARRMVLAISSESVPPKLDAALWQRLRARLDTRAFDIARCAILPLFDCGEADDAHHSGVLELFTGDRESCLTPQVADVIRRVAGAADGRGRKRIMRSLPRLLGNRSVGDVATELAIMCFDSDLTALGVALEALDTADTVPDAVCDVLSPLVALEYPTLSARLAERVLETLDPGASRAVTAALTWITTSPATACVDPARRWRMLRRIVAMSRGDLPSAPLIRAGVAGLRSFTRRSASTQLCELAVRHELSSGGLSLVPCCLAGLAMAMNNLMDQAAVWCWRARSLASTSKAARVWVLIVHSLVAFHHQDEKLASDLLARAAEATSAMRASRVAQFCELAMHYLQKGSDGSKLLLPLDEGAHAVLRVFAMHCSAGLDRRKGSVQLAIDKHFATGRSLASAKLTNPSILNWRQQLRAIFVSCHEDAIAECLQNDMCAAEKSWRTINKLSNSSMCPSNFSPDAADDSRRLSVSEQRVAEQIAAGCTNAQAADALYLSKRTVDTHLRNIYRRLGISSRGELIKFVKQNRQETDPEI